MKVLKLTIQNFMAVGNITDLELDDKGLVLIQGENQDDTSQDSNGAGKSTIAEALCWAFYGETARGESGDAVVNDKAGKNTAVEVVVVDNEAVYKIARYRKHKPYKNMLRVEIQEGEGWKDVTKGTDKLTQVLVNKIIGCTHEVFASAIYAGQEKMPDLPGMTDKQLKMLVEEAAGINELQEAHEVARRRLQESKSTLNLATSGLQNANNSLMDAKANLSRVEALIQQQDDEKKDRIEKATAQIEKDKAEYDPATIAKIEAKIADETNLAAKLKAKIASVTEEVEKERELSKAASDADSEVKVLTSRLESAVANVNQAKHNLTHVGDKIGTSCESCGHVIEEGDLEATRKQATETAKTVVARAKQLQSELQSARERAESAHTTLSAHRAAMTDISDVSRAQSETESRLQRLNQLLQAQRQKKVDIDNSEAKLAELIAAPNPSLPLLAGAQAQVEACEKKIKGLQEAQDRANKQVDIHEQAVRVFSPAGVRAHILDTVTPYLNSRTSHYLAGLTDGNITAVWSTISLTSKGEVREKFSIDVSSNTGAKSFKGLSGGEKRKVRLACAMALQDLVASRATKPIKLFVADEIDHALDPAGLERLMTILEEKAHDKGTVLVISHTDLRDWIKTSITVVKKGGASYLEPVCLS